MGRGQYILVDKKPVPEDDLLAWGMWLEQKDNRIVATTEVGKFFVSTVFLGIDHNFGGRSSPVLFETMIFNHSKTEKVDMPGFQAMEFFPEVYCHRYCTWEEAEAGHKVAVRMAEANNFEREPSEEG